MVETNSPDQSQGKIWEQSNFHHSEVTQLNQAVGATYIIAYKENTQRLEAVLNAEGLMCEVLRQVWKPGYETYARIYLAMLNHWSAWERIAQSDQITLVVEADFVPVQGIGRLPLPFDPTHTDVGMAWLYACAPQIYTVSPQGHAEGFSTSMVAYLITPAAAQALVEMGQAIAQSDQAGTYINWDSGIEEFLRKKGFRNFVPFRNYGEHGGRPNPEHRQHGLSRMHRADVLYGRLAFVPYYAFDGDNAPPLMESATLSHHIRYGLARLYARAKGLGRLLLGKFVRWQICRESSVPGRLLGFAFGRQLSLRL